MAVRLTTSTGSRNEVDLSEKIICAICGSQFSKYTCPKCGVKYCSLRCYKSEGHAECAEEFYKQCCMDELKLTTGSTEDKAKMIDILTRMQNRGEDSESDEDGPEEAKSLEKRVAKIDLTADSENLWQCLTPQERAEFKKSLNSGVMSHLITVQSPWWENYPKIQPLGDSCVPSEAGPSSLPPISEDIPPIASLIKDGKVSPCLCYNVLNVLYAYAYAVRLFNCSPYDLPIEATQVVCELSAVLSDNLTFCTAKDALEHAIATVQNKSELFNSQDFSSSILKDVSFLLSSSGPSGFLLAIHALADLYRLLGEGRRQLKRNKPANGNATPVLM